MIQRRDPSKQRIAGRKAIRFGAREVLGLNSRCAMAPGPSERHGASASRLRLGEDWRDARAARAALADPYRVSHDDLKLKLGWA